MYGGCEVADAMMMTQGLGLRNPIRYKHQFSDGLPLLLLLNLCPVAC